MKNEIKVKLFQAGEGHKATEEEPKLDLLTTEGNEDKEAKGNEGDQEGKEDGQKDKKGKEVHEQHKDKAEENKKDGSININFSNLEKATSDLL